MQLLNPFLVGSKGALIWAFPKLRFVSIRLFIGSSFPLQPLAVIWVLCMQHQYTFQGVQGLVFVGGSGVLNALVYKFVCSKTSSWPALELVFSNPNNFVCFFINTFSCTIHSNQNVVFVCATAAQLEYAWE